MPIIINPGSGPVEGAAEAEATANLPHLLVDIGLDRTKWVRLPESEDYGDGRYAYLVYRDYRGTRCAEVQMPGLPLERVRYMQEAQNPFAYPRLYVDGSSWLWQFAVGVLGDILTGREED